MYMRLKKKGLSRVDKHLIAYIVLLSLYYRPADYVLGESIGKVLLVGTMFTNLLMMFFDFRNIRHCSPNIVWLIVFFLWCLIGSTSLNYFMGRPISLTNALTYYICNMGILLVTDTGLRKRPKVFLKAFVFVGGVACIINSITFFIYGYKGGMNPVTVIEGRTLSQNYFYFAEDNATIFWTWPVIVVTWVYYYEFSLKKRTMIWALLISTMIIVGYIYLWSVAAMIISAMTVVICMLFFSRRVKRKERFQRHKFLYSFNLYWILAFVFNYLIVFQQVYLRFQNLLTQILKKSITLNGRSLIWERVMFYCAKSPVIGYGYEQRSATIAKITMSHAHNLLLEILYRGGVIGLTLFVCSLFSIGKRLKRNRDHRLASFLGVIIATFICFSSVEWAFYRYPYLAIFVLAGQSRFMEQNRARETSRSMANDSIRKL